MNGLVTVSVELNNTGNCILYQFRKHINNIPDVAFSNAAMNFIICVRSLLLIQSKKNPKAINYEENKDELF